MYNLVKFGYRPVFRSIIDEVLSQATTGREEMYYKPAANVRESETGFEIELALPGFEKEEISLKIEKDQLTILAGSEKADTENNPGYTWNEFRKNGKYRRTFIVPENINTESIGAEYRNGILYVTLPKKEVQPSVSKEISIA